MDLQYQRSTGRILEEDTAIFVDQSYCFNAGEWNYPDSPLRGVYPRNEVYANVRGWDSFEPWLSSIENMDPQAIWEIAKVVPPEWYGGALEEIERLIQQLITRRQRVRSLIDAFRQSPREPFQNWKEAAASVS